ncbi:MAG: T9SS C-terminal target domain-containing protein [Bacteroidetes bacterium]|nr:MAG: T9SS C-terminal target domain-containing protein [Bacteroidota bacterium]REK07584.1 MAG: T9SS C-terminal target domain-containing protein [Bacteroidota bacterium]REK36983.1 MAG: T9SS C-terminal target domain-containing protein [Bacteroidota bacterium]REK47804.1 MAG: T9SS C-terminal target domain-containing protein [Bacteroidota bacterium]
MKKLLFLLFIPLLSKSQSVTWSVDVAPILYSKCTGCHNPSGIAPFSLITYADAYNEMADIEDAVSSGEMPPWPPDPNYTRFAHERVLSQQEKNSIIQWVQDGGPIGDTSLAPPPPVYTGIAEITNPDLLSQMQTYSVNTANDLYRCFVIPSGLASAQYITEIEVIPGNREIVHHVLVYEDSTNRPAQLDAADPGPGYTNFGGTGSLNSKLIGIWVPGQSVNRMPPGMGIRLGANTNIIIQVHYPGGTFNQTDSTQVRFKLSSTPLREISINPPLNHYQLDNGPLFIPANTIRTFTARFTLPTTYTVLAVGPHMHLIGKSITSYGVTPANDTIPFIHIPHWDFHWQGTYAFPRLLKLPAGTTLHSSATYDNTSANPHNPNNPPQNVSLGEATTDEMMLVYFASTLYQNGDEFIVQDSSSITGVQEMNVQGIINTIQLYDPYPNPARAEIRIQYLLPEHADVRISVIDMLGKIIWNSGMNKSVSGLHTETIPLHNLSKGHYIIRAESGGISRSKSFILE